jgi:hypothetical protein
VLVVPLVQATSIAVTMILMLLSSWQATNQMHPDDLIPLLTPVIENRTDYSKGNRLITGEAWKKIPRVRYLGNATLSF